MKIIVVEDQQIILQGIVKMIEHCAPGTLTYPFSSAAQALAALDEIEPDLTLTDIVMEGMDGLTFVREARKRLPEGRFVIVSGYPNFNYAQEAIALHVYAYLLKPIDRRQLEKILNDVGALCIGSEEPVYSALVRRTLRLVQAWSQQPVTVMMLANELHVVSTYLSNTVKKETGQALSEWIRKAQMAQAELWLRTTDMYLYEIAERLGYRDVKYFSNLFRNYYQDTPLHYRKKEKLDEENH